MKTAPAPVVVDSTPSPEIEAAPDAAPLLAPDLPTAAPLGAQAVDSAGKTAFKRMLRTISGTPAPAAKPAKP